MLKSYRQNSFSASAALALIWPEIRHTENWDKVWSREGREKTAKFTGNKLRQFQLANFSGQSNSTETSFKL
jgi:hypothetical protein